MSTYSAAALLATAAPEELTRHAEEVTLATRTRIDRVVAGESADVLEDYDEAIAQLADALRIMRLVSQSHPEEAHRNAGQAAEAALGKVAIGISLDPAVHERLSQVDLSDVDDETRFWMTRVLRDFRRAGVDRDEATRAKVKELQEELVEIGQTFGRNINSSSLTGYLPPSALEGLPADYVAAHPPGEDGLVAITTDYPDVVPFFTYAHDSDAREKMWRLFRQRAHPANIEVLQRLIAKRYELATLLGYRNWAHYATEDKMIGSEERSGSFIAEISAAAQGRMEREFAQLLARKRAGDPTAAAVEPWDVSYLSDQVKAERFAFDSQAMRAYFEYGRVKTGLMGVVEELFGVRFARREDIPVWHPEVEVYDVFDGDALLGRIFLDMHPRPNKFSHAAMFSMGAGKLGERLPECALLCNLPRPGENPALLVHSDVTTFFHEFGHLIHHILGGHQRRAGNSGLKAEWDFIEAPSQLLEEWTLDQATLARFAVHHETGEPISAELVAKMRAADEFGKGFWVRQQMSYADLSLGLYTADPATLDPTEVEREAIERHLPFKYVPETWLHLSFGHLDGYSSNYYTYMWSMVIAKDLFTGFDQADLLARGPAARYREQVLAPGGSRPAAELVRGFLGRDHTFDAYRAWLDKDIS